MEYIGDWSLILQSLRRISSEPVTIGGIALNSPLKLDWQLKPYIELCVSTDQSVLQMLLKFNHFASRNRAKERLQLSRYYKFGRLREYILGRLIDGQYVHFTEYVHALAVQAIPFDEVEADLARRVTNPDALQDCLREL